jgi:hypothetical protein
MLLMEENKLIYSELLRLKYNRKTIAGIFLSLLYMSILTILLVRAIPGLVALYNSVGVDYKIDNALFLWFGYHRFISISSYRLLFFATRLFPFVLLPLLLSWFGVDTYLKDQINQSISLLYLRSSRKKYFLGKLFVVFLASYLIVLLMLVFQLFLAIVGCLYLKQGEISIPGFELSDISIILQTCIKIPLYFSSVSVVSYTISLFVNIPAAPYMLPPIVAVGSSVLIAETTNNVPMDLAFYDSGLVSPHMEIYWYSILVFLIIAVVLTWVKICMTKEILESC